MAAFDGRRCDRRTSDRLPNREPAYGRESARLRCPMLRRTAMAQHQDFSFLNVQKCPDQSQPRDDSALDAAATSPHANLPKRIRWWMTG